jgi:late competence protein required for DNA uptake (superfamily II DNA/RNA helicase)
MKGMLKATPSFEGRHGVLGQLHERFNHSARPNAMRQQRRFILHGLGGTGKTQLVLKFIEQAGDQ